MLRMLCVIVVVAAATENLIAAAANEDAGFTYQTFGDHGVEDSFIFAGNYSGISNGALQLTPDTVNQGQISLHFNKSGRIMYDKPFKLYDKDDVASFNTTFVINIYTLVDQNWTTGDGMAFLIAPNVSVPDNSYGRWLGLTNASTDGNPSNRFVAIEFDTVKNVEGSDPDGNHLGLNVNSVRSIQTVSLSEYNITLSPRTELGANYTVWVGYNGTSKVLEVFMVLEGGEKPPNPILTEEIDLREYVNEESYFGFSGSTGSPEIELNCVLRWSLNVSEPGNQPGSKGLTIGVATGIPLVVILSLTLCAFVWYRRRKRSKGIEETAEFGKLRLPGMPREFKYKELKKATNGFDESLKLGEGGFGIVYKGVLSDHDGVNGSSSVVAVKKFSRDSIKSKEDFLAELTIIHRLRHRHLVPLVGWCYEKGKLLLVYDFMPNGSLETHLYDPNSDQETLNWSRRYTILSGVASALHYIHNEYYQKVVHRDLKASNILLDADFNGMLGDFGLARALEEERNSYAELHMAGVPGTIGYVAPECFHTGRATPESDVYGFGAVILEVVCGRNPGSRVQHEDRFYTLVDWVWTLHREGRIVEAVDERLGSEFSGEEAERLLLLGLACSHPVDVERPKTQILYQIISGNLPPPKVPPFKPVFTFNSMGPSGTSTSSLWSTLSLSMSSLDIGATPRKE